MNLIPNRKNHLKEADESGFGTRITGKHYRLLERNGQYNVKRIGIQGWILYQDLVEMSWLRFFGMVVLFFVLVNALFAHELLCEHKFVMVYHPGEEGKTVLNLEKINTMEKINELYDAMNE